MARAASTHKLSLLVGQLSSAEATADAAVEAVVAEASAAAQFGGLQYSKVLSTAAEANLTIVLRIFGSIFKGYLKNRHDYYYLVFTG